MAGEVHGKKEKSQFLHHRDAAFMRQGKRQRFYFWGFFGCCGLGIQRGAGPFGCPPQTDQVLKVLEEGLREKTHYDIRGDIPIYFPNLLYVLFMLRVNLNSVDGAHKSVTSDTIQSVEPLFV